MSCHDSREPSFTLVLESSGGDNLSDSDMMFPNGDGARNRAITMVVSVQCLCKISARCGRGLGPFLELYASEQQSYVPVLSDLERQGKNSRDPNSAVQSGMKPNSNSDYLSLSSTSWLLGPRESCRVSLVKFKFAPPY